MPISGKTHPRRFFGKLITATAVMTLIAATMAAQAGAQDEVPTCNGLAREFSTTMAMVNMNMMNGGGD